MATQARRSRKTAPARRAERPAARNQARARKATAPAARRPGRSRIAAKQAGPSSPSGRRAAELVSRSVRSIPQRAASWSTLRIVWRPAIAMAMLPYRVYRVYRWAEAESNRSAISAPAAP